MPSWPVSRARAAGPVPTRGRGTGRTRSRTGCSTPAPALRGRGPREQAELMVGDRHARPVAEMFFDGEGFAVPVLYLIQPSAKVALLNSSNVLRALS